MHSAVLHILVALAAVIATGHVLASLLARLGQPRVIGEVLAGILLGPSLIGVSLSAQILPPADAPYLRVVAQLGVVLYMFIVGLELNAGLLRQRARLTLAISNAGIVLPFAAGAALAVFLHASFAPPGVPLLSFVLFMGIAMSVTAFPVLARILADRGMMRSELGQLALGCAAAQDITAWCLLALVVGVVTSSVSDSLQVFAGAAVYLALMLLVARPLLQRLLGGWQLPQMQRGAFAVVLVGVLLSAAATEAIGLHALFGAFFLGVLIPHDSVVADGLKARLEPVVTVLLLPAFFAYTGMRTRIDLVEGWEAWTICALIIAIATAGKLGGTYLAARFCGMARRESAALGALMNTRGLMELIVLNIGLDLGVISPTLFSMMVLMALITTLATAPLLKVLLGPAATEPLAAVK